jgi:hypothetical protein
MGRLAILKEFWAFLKTGKKFWLMPIILLLIVLSLIIILTEGSALSPFIYMLF